MLKISDDTIEIIADRIVDSIIQGRMFKEDAESGGGWQSKENLELLWYSYIKRVNPHEKKYIVTIKSLLTRQAKEVFDKIKRYPNDYKKWMFDRKKWLREFTEAEAKFIVKLYKQEGQKAIDLALKLSRKSYYKAEEIPITIAFDVYNPEVTETLVAQTTRFPAGVVGTSEEIIRREIANGLELGESIDKLKKRVTGRLGPDYIKNRAEMIARSETIYASNAGAELGYMQSGVVEGKKWLTALDERTCDPCTDMNNMTAPLGQPTWEKEGLNIGDVQGKYGLDFDYTEGAMPFPPLHPRCLIDGQIKIYTSKGWRPIRGITIGDLVLTHKGRFKKVTQLHFTPKQKPDVVKLVLESGRQQTKLTVTENHPILIKDKWIVARDVKIGDKINYLASKCKRCNKLIPYYNTYCSYSCNSKDITKRQWNNPEHRENISNKARAQMKREYANGTLDRFEITKKANEKTRQLIKEGKFIFQQDWVIEKNKKVTNLPHHNKANSERMKKNNPSHNPEVRKRMTESFKKTMLEHPERHPNYIMAQKGFISGIEKKYKSILDSLGIFYKQQYPIKQYFVDFAIPNLKVAIEIDGSYWHQEVEKDIIRQKEIEREGWSFIRFGEEDINNNIRLVKDETKRVILNHKRGYKFIPLKIKRIEEWKVKKPRMLYNLSVEGDESYIANGFIIHNCRCTITPIIKMVTKKPPKLDSPKIRNNLITTRKERSEALNILYKKKEKAFDKWNTAVDREIRAKAFAEYKKFEEKIDLLHKSLFGNYDDILIANKKGFKIDTLRIDNAFTKEEKKIINKTLNDFTKYFDEKNMKLLRTNIMKNPGNRAYCRGGNIHMKFETPAQAKEQIFHEMGHVIEYNSGKVSTQMRSFYKVRTKGETLQNLGGGYGADEMYYKDKFMDKYIGKYYEDGSTEILSMGLDYMVREPVDLAIKDPEMFDLVMRVLRGI